MSFLASSGESFLVHLLPETRFFDEKVEPSFLHTPIAFRLDFQGLGLPGNLKKKETRVSKNENLFEERKNIFPNANNIPSFGGPRDALKRNKN